MSPTPSQPTRSRPQDRTGSSASNVSRWRQPLRRAFSFAFALALGLVLWTFGADQRAPEVASTPAWGDEAAHARPMAAADWLPMAPANACGLGASSCFKCHNGKRAALPKSEPATGPWHAHHSKVNNSCVGCHKGNPRVLKEDVAHAKMIAKPRDDAGGSCAGCHTSDLAKVKAAYTGGK
ncbi:MAG: hypothetical protein IPM15_06820 [Betaproteobacteria bacterium]|nr:hypothetical protein [Betaproteobacteria bacterium]MCC6249288.1 hypothetical protein [Rubrivivax sp.]